MTLRLVYIAMACSVLFQCDISTRLNKSVIDGAFNLDEAGGCSDGTEDNTALLNRALRNAAVNTIELGEGTYLFSKTISIVGRNIRFVGEGPAVTKITGIGKSTFDVGAHLIGKYIHQEPLRNEDTVLVIPGLVDVEVGSIVHIHSPVGMPESRGGGHTTEHSAKVSSVHGDTITISDAVQLPFTEGITVSFYAPQYFGLESMAVENSQTLYMIKLHNLSNVNIENVEFTGAERKFQGKYLTNPERGTSAVAAYGCHNLHVDSCVFRHIWYGLMAHKACRGVMLSNSYAEYCRHISNSAIGTDGYQVVNCITRACNGGFDSHETGLGTSFRNCREYEPRSISKFRGRRDTLINCYFEGDIEFRIDPGIFDMAQDTTEIAKVMRQCTVIGRTVIVAGNVYLEDSHFGGPVHPHTMSGDFSMHNCSINVSASKYDYFTALTLTDLDALNGPVTYSLDQVDITGPGALNSKYVIGIYIPMKSQASVSMTNVRVHAFKEGIALHGHSSSYTGFHADSIVLDHCATGIKRQGRNVSPINLGTLDFNACEEQFSDVTAFTHRE